MMYMYAIGFYLATTFFIWIRFYVVSKKMNSQAQYSIESISFQIKALDKILIAFFEWLFLIAWPIWLAAFPKHFVKLMFFSDIPALARLIVATGLLAGRCRRVIRILFGV